MVYISCNNVYSVHVECDARHEVLFMSVSPLGVVHIGIRPKYKLLNRTHNNKVFHYEMLPDGSIRHWTTRQLKSGCNQVVTCRKYIDDLIYCEHCDEYFSSNQFEETEDEARGVH